MIPSLRPYQDALVADIRGAFARHRRVLAVASTGAGKTVTFAYIATAAAAKGNRVTIVVHRGEIVDQISRALDAFGVRHGRIQPKHPPTDDAVQVAMIATLGRRLDRVPEPDLLVVDESHHAISPTYVAVFTRWQRARILGVTATPERLDGRGLGDVFDVLVEAPPMADLIRDGWLAGYDYLAPPERMDLSAVKTRLGDYAIDDLAAALDRATITGDAIGHYRRFLDGRPAICFCVTVAHAEHVAQQFREAGYRAASVDGSMTEQERHERLASIGDGRLQVLTSCELISEGVDVPVVAGAILLRPTKSLATYLQQVGRVLRPKPDGSRAVILDHVGNVHRHGLPDTPRVWTLESKPKRDRVPTQRCDVCYRVFVTDPGWRNGQTCNETAPGPDCILALEPAAEPAERELPEVVDGELVAVAAPPAVAAAVEWAPGIDIRTASGDAWKRLLRLADTRERLAEIARIRGFKRGWVHFVEQQRQQRRGPSMPFIPTPAPQPEPPSFAAAATDELVEALTL